MKYFIMIVGANIATLACLFTSIHLVIRERDGWGWFLFAAILGYLVSVLINRTVEYHENKKEGRKWTRKSGRRSTRR